MSSNYLEKIIYLSQEDYDTLLGGGTVTKNGRTLSGINPNYIYVTDETNISNITGLTELLSELDNKILIKTTAEWSATPRYIPPKDTILIYSDRNTIVKNNVTYYVAGIKLGNGQNYGIDLPFVGDDIAAQIMADLTDHINDNVRHITSTERTFWNNKLNCDFNNETLILNRL